VLIAKFTLEIRKNAHEIQKNSPETTENAHAGTENALEIANYKTEFSVYHPKKP